ncbi:MAG: hypothetical protein KME11_04950 [Timaviella obliquedivisa GSE-PSE-MK23-08B]|jgi:hypothetical protein|nr:hypothetical protein [Timaviella obliquedivisa GSE-PSE-MK23-08B]
MENPKIEAELDDSIMSFVKKSLGLRDEELAEARIAMIEDGDSVEIRVTFPGEGLQVEDQHRDAIAQLLRISGDSE